MKYTLNTDKCIDKSKTILHLYHYLIHDYRVRSKLEAANTAFDKKEIEGNESDKRFIKLKENLKTLGVECYKKEKLF